MDESFSLSLKPQLLPEVVILHISWSFPDNICGLCVIKIVPDVATARLSKNTKKLHQVK